VTDYLNRIFKKEKFERVGDILKRLKKIPEYRESLKDNACPKIILGSPEKKAGQIMVDMTGGTEESEHLLEKFSQAGVGTMVCMHMSEKHVEEAKKHHLNIIIAGHIASDTLGLNRILDDLDPKGKMEIISCSGFTRIKR
jgi:putative NIF3 family GTP cyclohydrolase 1 type 2